MTVSNEAIAVATESVIASLAALELGWVDTDMPDGVTIDVRDFDLSAAISKAIEAAAPYLQAEAWDEGYTTGNAHNGRRDANPYKGQP